MADIGLIERPTITPTLDGNNTKLSHIVVEGYQPKDEEGNDAGEWFSVDNSVADGIILGKPVTALCGHRWIPGDDPSKYPVCPRCVEVAKEHGWRVPTG